MAVTSPQYRTTTCKSCGRYITWARTASGKLMPLDHPPEMRFIITGEQNNEYYGRMAETWRSHFATCPHAAEHRKKPV